MKLFCICLIETAILWVCSSSYFSFTSSCHLSFLPLRVAFAIVLVFNIFVLSIASQKSSPWWPIFSTLIFKPKSQIHIFSLSCLSRSNLTFPICLLNTSLLVPTDIHYVYIWILILSLALGYPNPTPIMFWFPFSIIILLLLGLKKNKSSFFPLFSFVSHMWSSRMIQSSFAVSIKSVSYLSLQLLLC